MASLAETKGMSQTEIEAANDAYFNDGPLASHRMY
jgi:hypothetical protein